MCACVNVIVQLSFFWQPVLQCLLGCVVQSCLNVCLAELLFLSECLFSWVVIIVWMFVLFILVWMLVCVVQSCLNVSLCCSILSECLFSWVVILYGWLSVSLSLVWMFVQLSWVFSVVWMFVQLSWSVLSDILLNSVERLIWSFVCVVQSCLNLRTALLSCTHSKD